MLLCMQELNSGSSAADAADDEALIGAPQPEEPMQDGELILVNDCLSEMAPAGERYAPGLIT